MTLKRPDDGAPPAASSRVEMLLGRSTLGELRRRARTRLPRDDDTPADRKLPPVAGHGWLRRSVRHPLAVLFLVLGAATTASLVFAASRLDDDGSLSGVDWFRLGVVGIVAMAFFVRLLELLLRLPPFRWVRRTIGRRNEPSSATPVAHIPSVESVELAGRIGDGFGRLSSVERARLRNQAKLDDLFWLGINLAIIVLGAAAVYGLGYTALRDLVDGDDRSWAVARIALFVLAFMGLVRVLRMSIGQLRMRHQRRRRRAVHRLLRYLLWWDRPAAGAAPVMATSTRRQGPAAVGGLTPFLVCCGIAVTAAAYSPWGAPISSPAVDAIVEPTVDGGTGTAMAPPTADDEAAVSDAAAATAASSSITQPGAATSTAPDAATTSTVFAVTATSSGPSAPPTTPPAGPVSDTATTQAPTAPTAPTATAPTAPPEARSATTQVRTATTAPATTPTTQAPATTAATSTTATTSISTTTTKPPAPQMMIVSFSAVFFCDAGATRFDVSWSASGDAGGRVDIFRNGPDGFTQIGNEVDLDSSLVDTPPSSGTYQYWLIANNSEFADETATRDVGTVDTDCID